MQNSHSYIDKTKILITNGNLRTIMGNTSLIEIFLNILHTVRFMYGLLYEIKRICHHAHFFIVSHGIFQHFTNFLKKKNKTLLLSEDICNRLPASLV